MASGAFKFGPSIKMAMSTLVPDQIMTSNVQGRKVIFLVVSEASFEVRNNILAKIKANLDIHGAARIDRVKQNLNIPS